MTPLTNESINILVGHQSAQGTSDQDALDLDGCGKREMDLRVIFEEHQLSVDDATVCFDVVHFKVEPGIVLANDTDQKIGNSQIAVLMRVKADRSDLAKLFLCGNEAEIKLLV